MAIPKRLSVEMKLLMHKEVFLIGAVAIAAAVWALTPATGRGAPLPASAYEVNDSHFHLANHVQEGTNINDLLRIMGTKVGRVALFGTDAVIARAYQSLSPADRARFDPMITGFNPTDMDAADHVRRVLTTFPGVFEGIGEFTIHKEFVSSKIAGETASLTSRALDRLLDFAAEVGLVVLIHNDIDAPFPKPGQEPYQVLQLRDFVERHPKTTIIWAHMGLGRVVRPIHDQIGIIDRALSSPALNNLYVDLSWDETAKYIVATPEAVGITAELINKHSDRFLFGTDEVAPSNQTGYLKVYQLYEPLFARLTPSAKEQVRKANYLRLFDEARRKVRAWERAHGIAADSVVPRSTR
jgi:predicted TIM-barrel fold metal-dependent hydrolase